MSRRRKPTVWEALNEPIIHVTEQQGKNVIFAALVIAFTAWIAPYWGSAGATAYYAPINVFEEFASAADEGGMVAGAQIVSDAVPAEWYYVTREMPNSIVESFAIGANEVLDISGPVTEMTEFYQPGIEAVSNAWLNLMRDPGTPEF